jgi:hypothetical protein
MKIYTTISDTIVNLHEKWRLEKMAAKKGSWFLILDSGSQLSNQWGAYELKTIENCREMRTLPRCSHV